MQPLRTTFNYRAMKIRDGLLNKPNKKKKEEENGLYMKPGALNVMDHIYSPKYPVLQSYSGKPES